MRILLVHNYYQFSGGEDIVVQKEYDILSKKGHEVELFTCSNSEIKESSLAGKIKFPFDLIWNQSRLDKLNRVVEEFDPEIVHFHNTHFMMSPSVFHINKRNAVIVATIHNYRLVCPAAILYRNGQPCNLCVEKWFSLPGVIHGCYRDSRLLSGLVGLSVGTHHWLNTWNEHIDAYIALTEFMKERLVKGGIPQDRIFVKPNFAQASEPHSINPVRATQAIYVGRLVDEKGITTVIEAWQYLQHIPLVIVGDGPLRDHLQNLVSAYNLDQVVSLWGHQNHDEVFEIMRSSSFLVMPSKWYEGFPLSIIESYANKLPVVASDLGVMKEIVIDGQTGFLFNPNDVQDLVHKIEKLTTTDGLLEEFGENAFQQYERLYSIESNYEKLMKIYATTLEKHSSNV